MPVARKDAPVKTPTEAPLTTREPGEASKAVSPPAFLDTVRAAILGGLDARDASLVAVAKAMSLAPRTLQRRLHAEGQSLQGLLDDVRRSRAIALLANPSIPVKVISDNLGYAEPAVFFRAFRRWTGFAPGAFRTRRLP